MPDIELSHSCLVPCTEKMTEYAKRVCIDCIADKLMDFCTVEQCTGPEQENMVKVELVVKVRRGE